MNAEGSKGAVDGELECVRVGVIAMAKAGLALVMRAHKPHGWGALILRLASEKLAHDAREHMSREEHTQMMALLDREGGTFRAVAAGVDVQRAEGAAIVANVLGGASR